MPQLTEWEFTGDVASRINRLLQSYPELPFKEARIEMRQAGRAKRRDLTLLNRRDKPVLTGEVKMPDKPDGRSPFQHGVVEDAHHKADDAGAEYNFTWNVNRFVLWKTFETGKPISQRDIEHWEVLPAPIRTSDETLHSRVQAQIDDFLLKFLTRFADILSGAVPMRQAPLDEKFIVVYESSLEAPVAQTLAAIHARYQRDRDFVRDLDQWMREDQEWVISKDEDVLRDNLERAAKFSCYVLANKIVFYKALRRRFSKLHALRIPKHIGEGSDLSRHLNDLFRHAVEVTRDYETVFQNTFGDTLPFLSDEAVDSWRDLSEQTDGFDFTQLNHEIIGLIFERLLSTEERHKYGQHYTRSEVVDLINTFCIRAATARVLDPACGGGTFLVRAYARKKALAQGRLKHRDLLQQLYGFDISAYPVHLTTINLVTRDLIDEANYPLVARHDFFDVRLHDAPFTIPFAGEDAPLTMSGIGKVEAVVGNPPYVRQEKIGEYYGVQYKQNLQKLAAREASGAAFSGRSDLHVYFFPHAATFLENGGYLGLLTSSTWLDTAYGFRLQKYLLDNFEIIAILESASEPWFTGARVTTAATILRRQSDPARRAANIMHFVKIQRELSDILTPYIDEDSRRQFFERVRDHIEEMTRDEVTEDWRIRCIRQAELYRLGQLSIEVDESEEEDDENGEARQATLREPGTEYHAGGEYVGYKWGIFLRAPDVFFKLRERCGDALVPFSEIAEVKRGVTSGADDFFFPEDITKEESNRLLNAREFKETHGIRPSDTDRVRIVRAGDGSVHLLEARFLEPEVHSLMEIDGIGIETRNLKRSIFLCSLTKDELRKRGFKHALDYVRWGEREGFDQRPTCTSRERWYELSIDRRGDMFWPMAQQYRHIIALNSQNLICNHNLFDVFANGFDTEVLCAILNSTFVALSKHQFGRFMGREGNLKTETIDVKMMLVPDARHADKAIVRRLRSALASMRKREALPLVDVDGTGDEWSGELATADRQELDDVVLELMGIRDRKEREALRAELYAEMTKLYREIRATEKKMQKFRAESARRGRPSAQSIADEIWEMFSPKPVAQSLPDFVPVKVKTETITLPSGMPKAIFGDMFNPNSLQFGRQFIALGSPERVRYALQLVESSISGQVPIPIDPAVCAKAIEQYLRQQADLSEKFMAAAATYTADEQMRSRIVKELWKKAGES